MNFYQPVPAFLGSRRGAPLWKMKWDYMGVLGFLLLESLRATVEKLPYDHLERLLVCLHFALRIGVVCLLFDCLC